MLMMLTFYIKGLIVVFDSMIYLQYLNSFTVNQQLIHPVFINVN